MKENDSENAPTPVILVVDDEARIRELVTRALEGRAVIAAGSAAEARERFAEADLVLCDLRLGGDDGMELLAEFRAARPEMPVIIMTAFASIESAIEAMRRGARDYITKPFLSLDALRLVVDRALAESALQRENERLRDLLVRQDRFEEMIGASAPMRRLYELIDRVARGETTVLVTGESGVGKELVARALHRRSPRAARPFFEINCAAIPETLLESELFGFERGAFTGANRAKRGLFEASTGGTLLLDEIAEMPTGVQAKLLRAIEEKSFIRLGGMNTVHFDARIIASTNRDLKQAIKKGAFREDLFYRLAVIEIAVPPLRDRPGDLARLLGAFLPDRPIEAEALAILEDYRWPGNIRELRNFCDRVKGLGLERVACDDLPVEMRAPRAEAGSRKLPDLVGAYERDLIVTALRECGGSISDAARKLGVSRQSLQYKIEKFDLR
jgi:two-component system NtrC family response regulator